MKTALSLETVSRQMPTAGHIVKTMTSNGKQITVTREMLTAVARDQGWPDVVAGISARFFKICFCFVLFCYITNHLMTGPLGNSEFCFPRISMFPETKSRETLIFEGNKIHCSPRDQSLSVKYNPPTYSRVGCGRKQNINRARGYPACPFSPYITPLRRLSTG